MTIEWLDAQLRSRLTEAQRAWLARAVERSAGEGRNALLQAYTEASRQLGSLALIDGSAADPPPYVLPRWSVTDAARLRLLMARFARGGDMTAAAADAVECFEQGDAQEQQSWLRGVSYLPDPASFMALAIDACRTNILPLFEAIACENPYPARYFPERNFNQLVLKAMFNGVALARIDGLAARRNASLARMAADYAAERRAAGRTVPSDIDLALGSAVEHPTDL